MNTWRVRSAHRGGAPTLTVGATTLSGTELLAGAERWAAAFHAAGLEPGDRLVTALPTGSHLAQVVLAGLWAGLTLVPLPPSVDPVVAAAESDPVAAVATSEAFGGRAVSWAWRVDGSGRAATPPAELRPAGPPSPLARLLCAPSGGGPWAALLDDNLEHAVDAVIAALRPDQARWLSVLPWHAPAGLLLDLLPALLTARDIVRPAADDVPAGDVANVMQRWLPSHAILPMPLVGELCRIWNGPGPLAELLGGLASGPGLDAGLAGHLRRTRLRTHRGAPELSCMVTLGEPGVWRPGALGRPVGCTIGDGPGGGLLVSGRPVAGGTWIEGVLHLVDRHSPVEVILT